MPRCYERKFDFDSAQHCDGECMGWRRLVSIAKRLIGRLIHILRMYSVFIAIAISPPTPYWGWILAYISLSAYYNTNNAIFANHPSLLSFFFLSTPVNSGERVRKMNWIGGHEVCVCVCVENKTKKSQVKYIWKPIPNANSFPFSMKSFLIILSFIYFSQPSFFPTLAWPLRQRSTLVKEASSQQQNIYFEPLSVAIFVYYIRFINGRS